MLLGHHGVLLAEQSGGGGGFGGAVLADAPPVFLRMTAEAGQQETNLGTAPGVHGAYTDANNHQYRQESLSKDSGDYSVQLGGVGFLSVNGYTFFSGSAGAPFASELVLASPGFGGLRAIQSFGVGAPYLRFNGANIEMLLSQVAMLGSYPHNLAPGATAYIVLVRRPGNVTELWLNGVMLGAVTQAYSGAQPVAYVGIEGGSYDRSSLRIDEFVFYEKALSGAQIAEHYALMSETS